jgi:thioredoxin reductase (NADPH)
MDPGSVIMAHDIIIVGAGPAGLTASIYAARAGMDVTVLEKAVPGGYAALTDIIENYPGFPEGIKGIDLAEKMKKHAQRFDVRIVGTEVKKISASPRTFQVQTSSQTYTAPAVVVATGTSPRKLLIRGEEELRGRGVSYCATCDGPLFKNRTVAVIGCGNSGLQEGHFLLNFVKEVVFVEYLPRITADKVLQRKFEHEDRARFILGAMLVSINGKEKVESITVKQRSDNTEQTIGVDGVFIFVGTTPASDCVRGLVELDKHGFVITDEELRTSVKGLYAAGDIRSKHIRQVVTAHITMWNH